MPRHQNKHAISVFSRVYLVMVVTHAVSMFVVFDTAHIAEFFFHQPSAYNENADARTSNSIDRQHRLAQGITPDQILPILVSSRNPTPTTSYLDLRLRTVPLSQRTTHTTIPSIFHISILHPNRSCPFHPIPQISRPSTERRLIF